MYYTVIKHSGHLRTLEKCRKHSPAACVFYISLVFSNGHRVLSQCNTQLRLLYLLNKKYRSPCSFFKKEEDLFRYRAWLEGNFFRCLRAHAYLHALMARKLCAVGMRSAYWGITLTLSYIDWILSKSARSSKIFGGFGRKRALGFLLKIELCRKRSKFRMQFCLGALNNVLYVFLLKFSSFTR